MSVSPPKRSLRDLEQVVSRARRPAAQQLVLQYCALLRSFDEHLFNRVLTARLPANSQLSFANLVKLPEVAAVPRATNEFCIKDEARAQLLESWQDRPKELRAFSRRMTQYYQRRASLDRLTHLLFANPSKALRQLKAAYRAADRKGDLSTCDSLLRILRNRSTLLSQLAPSLFEFLQNQEQYLRSRVLFVDDWSRSTHYLERGHLTRRLEGFLRNRTRWLLQIHAKGGMGKTACLRWLVSRRLVVARSGAESRHAVARIDFDHLSRAAVASAPCLLLIPTADQLERQFAHGVTSSLFRTFLEDTSRFAPTLFPAPVRGADPGGDLSISEVEKQNIESDFCQQLGEKPALVILDTIEEMVLHRSDEWLETLRLLERLQKRCPRLKVIVSGRYDFRTRQEFSGWSRAASRIMTTVAVKPFTARQSLKYLQRIRGLRPAFKRKRVPLPAEGNPFKLALFGDVIGAGGTFTLADLAELRYADVQYLILRIIERLPDCELQWTLRYAVVPHQLTKEFLDEVLLPHVRRESANADRDHPQENLPAGGEIVKATRSWQPCIGKFDIERVWSNLQKYASASSWIANEKGIPKLQPELEVPMRYLLQNQPVFADLHRDAAQYFERHADSIAGPERWAEFAIEALYHWFQAEGAAAGNDWRRLLDSPMARLPNVRQRLAASVLTADYLDDEGEPLPHGRAGTVIGLETLAEAHFELASAMTRRALERPDDRAPVAKIASHLKSVESFEARLNRRIVDAGRRALIEAHLQLQRGDNRKALEILDSALAGSLQEPRHEASLLVLKANIMTPVDLAAADQCYTRAAELSRAETAPFVAYHWIRARQGRLHFDRGDLEIAERHYGAAVHAMVEGQTPPSETIARLRDLIEVLHQSARWSEIEGWLRIANENLEDQELVGPFLSEQTARLAVAQMRMTDVRPSWSPHSGTAEWQAAQLAALHDPAALEGFDIATRAYQQAKNTSAGQSCRIGELLYLVRVLGNLTTAKSRASKLDPSGTNWLRGRLALVELWRRLSPGRGKDLWSRLWREAQTRCTTGEQAAALATALAAGLEPPSQAPRLAALLCTIRPAAARLPLLAPFEYYVLPERGRKASPGVFREVIPQLSPDDPDFALRALLAADALRYEGDRPTATTLLTTALELPAAREPLLRRKLLLALERLDAHVENTVVSSYLDDVQLRCIGFPSFVIAAHVEQVEWWLRRGRAELALQILHSPFVKKAEHVVWGEDQYWCRLLALYASMTDKKEEAALYARDARLVASRLGLPKTFVNVRQDLDIPRDESPVVPVWETPFRLDAQIVEVKRSHERELDVVTHAGRIMKHKTVSLQSESLLCDVLDTHGSTQALESLLGTPTTARDVLSRVLISAGFKNSDEGLLLQFDDDAIAALPWEWALEDQPYAYVSRGNGGDIIGETVRWTQSALSRLDHNLIVDGIAGPATVAALQHLVDAKGNVLAHGILNTAAKKRLRQLLPRSSIAVLCRHYELERSHRLGYGAFGVDIGTLWQRYVKEAATVDPTDASALGGALGSMRPDVIHITLSIAQSGSELRLATERSTEVFQSHMDPPSTISSGDLTPPALSQLILKVLGDATRPFVILDVPHRGSRGEVVRLLYLRNQFAQQLFAHGRVRGVLATGLAGERTQDLAHAIIQHVTRFDNAVALAKAIAPLAADAPSAIFANDPTIPIW